MYKIVRDKDIRNGKFIFEGTRISVDDIAESILSGLTLEEIEKEYPSVNNKIFEYFFDFTKKVFEIEINSLRKKASTSKEIENLFKYEGCYNYLKNLNSHDLYKSVNSPKLKVCLKILLSILRKYYKQKRKDEVFIG